MSEKFSAAREQKSKFDVHLPRMVPLSTDSSNLEDAHPMLIAAHLPQEVKLPTDRQVDSLCGTPIVFSNKLKSLQARSDRIEDKDRALQDSHVTQMESEQSRSTDLKVEWVEQYEPGVYVTFTILASGQKGLKRVRFSRKRFTEKGAEQWWEDNQLSVYQKYGIEGYFNSNQNQ
ncbi:protein Brevis radix-like 4 [Durio zibethinus]|nr:protein Brevis radix-like 4 [Durio zibethinus]